MEDKRNILGNLGDDKGPTFEEESNEFAGEDVTVSIITNNS